MKYLVALILLLLFANASHAANFFDYGSGQNFFDYNAGANNFFDYSGGNFFDYGGSSPVGAPLPTRTPTATLSNSLGL